MNLESRDRERAAHGHMDSTLCRLRCPRDTKEESATDSWVYTSRTRETDLGRKYILQNQDVIEDMEVSKHSWEVYVDTEKNGARTKH